MTTKTVAIMTCDQCGNEAPVDFDPKLAGPPPPPDGWFRVTMVEGRRSIQPDLCSIQCAKDKLGALLRNELSVDMPEEPQLVIALGPDATPEDAEAQREVLSAVQAAMLESRSKGDCGEPQVGPHGLTGLLCFLPLSHPDEHDYA